jgi:hypothetical protein
MTTLDETSSQDAVRLYEQMWSVERIARLFGTDAEVVRRLIARRTVLRPAERQHRPSSIPRTWKG